jgi:hypothetical protein
VDILWKSLARPHWAGSRHRSPFLQGAAARDLVVLHGLAAADDGGMLGGAAFRVLDDAFGLASVIRPSMASHFSPSGFLPSDLKTASRTLI